MAKFRQKNLYVNIFRKIWNDNKFPFLKDGIQLVYFHLLTTPYSNALGLFKASIGALADEKRWNLKKYKAAVNELIKLEIIDVCEKHQVIYLKNYFKYNPPTSVNSWQNWVFLLNELPDCRLKREWYQNLKNKKYAESDIIPNGISHGILDGILDGMSHGMSHGKQDGKAHGKQDPLALALAIDKENIEKKVMRKNCTAKNSSTIVEDASLTSTSSSSKIIYEVFDYWRTVMNHPKAILDKKRKTIIAKTLKSYNNDSANLKLAVDGCAQSGFHMGKNPLGEVYDSIELILRDADHVEKFIQLAEKKKNQKSVVEDFISGGDEK